MSTRRSFSPLGLSRAGFALGALLLGSASLALGLATQDGSQEILGPTDSPAYYRSGPHLPGYSFT